MRALLTVALLVAAGCGSASIEGPSGLSYGGAMGPAPIAQPFELQKSGRGEQPFVALVPAGGSILAGAFLAGSPARMRPAIARFDSFGKLLWMAGLPEDLRVVSVEAEADGAATVRTDGALLRFDAGGTLR